MEKEVLKIPSIISGVKTMSDKGLRVSVDTQELGPEDAGKVMVMKDKAGWFVFAEQITEQDVKDLPEIQLEAKEKSPSERLRAVLFIYWEQHKIKEPFDIWYRRWMDKKINEVKEHLN